MRVIIIIIIIAVVGCYVDRIGRTGIIYGRRDIMSSRYVLHSFFIHKYEYTRINTKILLLYYYNVMYGQISFV